MFSATETGIFLLRSSTSGAQLIRRTYARLSIVALSLCTGRLGAQSDSAALRPVDYQFTIDLPDSGAAINGDARIAFIRQAPADSLTLDLIAAPESGRSMV